jgi:hypothetical protein
MGSPIEALKVFNGPDRRRRTRFPIELGARYATGGRETIAGTGRTVNISSRGVLLTSSHSLSPDTAIKVAIEWPILIDDVCPLALHIRGTVVRSDAGLIAVRFVTHEMRTQPKPANRLQAVQTEQGQTSSSR